MTDKPKTFAELFKFYHDYVKLLYGFTSAGNALPQEVLFELNAALDHISRHWAYGETEEAVVSKAYSHFKRSCLDIFKLKLKETNDNFERLKKVDTSIIDNGAFDRKMIQWITGIRRDATEARRLEGQLSEDPDAVPSFERWEPVYEKCLEFNEQFYENEHVEWAKKKQRKYSMRHLIITAILSFIVGLLVNYVSGILVN